MRGHVRRLLVAGAVVFAAGSLGAVDSRADDQLQVDDAKLESFVDAYRAVHEVANESMDRIQAVQTDEEFKDLQAELEPKFEAAIEETDGITLAEFREIEAAAVKDEALGQRIVEKMQAEGGAPAAGHQH